MLAAFDYGALDRDGQSVRIRLDSTCIDVRNVGDEVHRRLCPRRRDCIAWRQSTRCSPASTWSIPHIMPELPAAQREALAQNVKTPIVYTNVLVRDWRPWVRLGVHDISAPMSFHSRVKLDFPVSLGGYRHPRDPAEPIVPASRPRRRRAQPGLDARTQFRIGQGKLLAMTFADFEDADPRRARPHARPRRLLQRARHRGHHRQPLAARLRLCRELAVTTATTTSAVLERARQKCGRVAIANSDAGGDAYAHLAIDQAARAVRELVP